MVFLMIISTFPIISAYALISRAIFQYVFFFVLGLKSHRLQPKYGSNSMFAYNIGQIKHVFLSKIHQEGLCVSSFRECISHAVAVYCILPSAGGYSSELTLLALISQ